MEYWGIPQDGNGAGGPGGTPRRPNVGPGGGFNINIGIHDHVP